MKLYTTPNCKYCPDVKRDMTIMGISFEEVTVTPDVAKYLHEKGIRGVPALETDTAFLVGDEIKPYIHNL